MTYDVAVIGGGPAGCAAAATVARNGGRVVLFDDGAQRSLVPSQSVPPGTARLLDDIFGADAKPFDAADHLPSYGSRSRWGHDDEQARDHLFHPDGHGWHLDRIRFDQRLRAALDHVGVERRADRVRPPIEHGDDGWWLPDCRAIVVVDATGRGASIGRSLGAGRTTMDRLVAVIATFDASGSDADRASVVASAPAGWWYTAPITDTRRMVAFFTDADLLPDGIRREDGLLAWLSRAPSIVSILEAAGARLAGAPRVVAADIAVLDPVGDASWIAAGDAVASFDPLSSQGVVTALASGRDAATALASTDGLDRYRRTRDQIMREHLRLRSSHYLDELRWPDEPFWSRRHRVAAPGPR